MSRLQQKGFQQAAGQTHTLLCTNFQNSGHLQRMMALSVPASHGYGFHHLLGKEGDFPGGPAPSGEEAGQRVG